MNVAFVISDSDRHVSHFADVKMKVVLVIVRCDPAHPHATGLLSRKHSHRIIVLVKEEGGGGGINISISISKFQVRMIQHEH